MRDTVKARLGEDKFDAAAWDVFAKQLFYQQLDITNAAEYATLNASVQAIETAGRGWKAIRLGLCTWRRLRI